MRYDPTTTRLSDHFLLSDLLGCNSVYTRGLPNPFEDATGAKLREGRVLAEHLLEPLLAYSRLSIAYGYISPELSREIVKYQDPNKPSYHRWDAGAACDIAAHDELAVGQAPIFTAFWIDKHLPVSRTITYSESPYICVATRAQEVEKGDPRRALYENRYVGERKPLYIKYPDTYEGRVLQKREVKLTHGWKGAGYPTYHAGGVRGWEHIRTSRFTMMSDFLYSTVAIEYGYANAPSQRAQAKFKQAGALIDGLLFATRARRLSIVRGYESPSWIESVHNWKNGIYLVVVPPATLDPDTLADAAKTLPQVSTVRRGKDRRVAIKAELQ